MGRVTDERLAWAQAKLGEAQRIALRYFGTTLRIQRKRDDSPVTVADRKVETFLRAQLRKAFPREVIVGEEFGAPADPGRSYWTVDPIDGTRAFSRGLPSWGMLLSFVEDGKPVMGACLYPATRMFLGAGQGVPAFESDGGARRLLPRVTTPPALSRSAVFHGGSSWWLGSPYGAGFTRLVRQVYLERAYGDCYGYLWLLRGHCDAMIEYGVKVWDVAPFAAIAGSTGRVMLDCSGRAAFQGPECIVAHPKLARHIAEVLAQHA